MAISTDTVLKILLAPIAAFLIPIFWNFASIPISFLRELAMNSPSLVEMEFELSDPCLDKAQFKCLLVRYGTDEYIRSMASEQEKYDGRLRNKMIDCLYENGKLSFTIPVHKRIGSQFKCFMEVPSESEARDIIEKQSKLKEIYDLSHSSSQNRNRIYFLLRDYGETVTVDGLKNNMIYPV